MCPIVVVPFIYLTDWCDNNSDTENDPKEIIQNMLCYGNIILQ